MIIKRKYNFIRSKTGFKDFIRYNISEAERFIENYKRFPLFTENKLEEYIGALQLIDIKNKLYKQLNETEKYVLSYFRYHSPNESEPINYYEIIEKIYLIWLKLLPKDDLKLSPFILGQTMKRIRIENNISIISMSLIMGVDRNTITKYEQGERLPSLEYFYRFCVRFNLSMDKILSIKLKMHYLD